MKKHLTEEQKARALERRERFKTLCKKLAAMSDGERAQLTSAIGAVVTCEGRALSLTNTLLLLLQRGRNGVSMVGGFRQWKKAGRYVRKGESGNGIWIPTGARKSEMPALEGSEMSLRELAEAGESGSSRRFLVGTVFDISQTEAMGGADGPAVDVEAEAVPDMPAPLALPVASVSPVVSPQLSLF